MSQRYGRYSRALVALIATLYFAHAAFIPNEWHFVDAVNLIFHEAGHFVFLPFGQFMHILGGSLFQVLLPLLYIGYFYFKQQYFSASLLLFWMGQSLVNVSVYASDAIAMQLPLLGGDGVGHDWNTLLSMLHLLPHTQAIGFGIYLVGVLVIGLATCLSFVFALPRELSNSAE